MREDIKRRLEQVQAGEIPEGYQGKHSYAFPKDWKMCKLNDQFSRLTRKNNEENENVLTISAKQGLISQEDYYNHSYASEDKSGYSLLRRGDYSYNKSYSGDYPYGAIKRLEMYEFGIVSPLYICFESKTGTISDYYMHYFEAGIFNREIYKIAQEGARNHGLLNVAIDEFFSSYLLNPPTKEQQKIAEILNHCDKVIELKQRLIEEERNRKKWLMQNLFDPDSDFRSINWLCTWTQSKLLGLCISICDGDWIESKDQSEAGIRLIQTGNIGVNNYIDKAERARYISQNTFDYLNCTEVTNGDVLLSRLPDPIGRACMIENLKEKAITAVDCSILKFHNNNTAKYFLQYASTNIYFKQIAILAGGSTRTRISRKEIENLTIPIPDSLDVQEDIVNALSTIDNNITLLENELAQWQQKKKSLMQLLLTGIVRVTV